MNPLKYALLKFNNQTCPWWFIGSFDNPLRRMVHSPEQILANLVDEGQTVLDIGPGMGYFTIPLAKMVGPSGIVIAADLQRQMLDGLRRRAEQAGLLDRIQLHLSQPDQIGVTTPLDFALAFWMLHEVRNQDSFLAEIFHTLKPGARLLLVEPVIHVSRRQFLLEVQIADEQGFRAEPGPKVRYSRSILLVKPA